MLLGDLQDTCDTGIPRQQSTVDSLVECTPHPLMLSLVPTYFKNYQRKKEMGLRALPQKFSLRQKSASPE